jgi:hypothetical protein
VIVRRHPLALLLLLAPGACGGQPTSRVPSSWSAFECDGRAISYFVVGSLAADEAGVTVDCAQGGPRVQRWTLGRDGTRVEDSSAMTPGEFQDLWKRVEGSGWRNLRDCPPEDGGNVPVYTFEVTRGDETRSFSCDALRPPFPWGSLVDELDQAAAAIRGTRGKNILELDDDEG